VFGRATITLGIGPHSSFNMEPRLKATETLKTQDRKCVTMELLCPLCCEICDQLFSIRVSFYFRDFWHEFFSAFLRLT